MTKDEKERSKRSKVHVKTALRCLPFFMIMRGGWVVEVNRTAAVTTHSRDSTLRQTDPVKQEIKTLGVKVPILIDRVEVSHAG
ncbi:MAG: hypothetical protein A2Z51_12225 [Deltaproteobacteria bacterium RBG_19FT_COMBO_52_11]|nr:MAG: hypothetical protein A2Z51_12225 [Deltaproteobacteria bacterium RBG_19FT_COMBO_52_11]